MKCDELFKLLKKNGWKKVRQKGSHIILRKEDVNNAIVLPYHRGKEVPTGTASSILKQAGLK
jgi:mRNA interferase HicA